jgi:hypothetical protein
MILTALTRLHLFRYRRPVVQRLGLMNGRRGSSMRTVRIDRTAALALCAVALVGAGGGTAYAGEITGTGESLQIAPHTLHGKSACAFSGLNDAYVLGDHSVSRTQTFPQFSRDVTPLPPGTPGIACNPQRSSGEP